MAEARVRLAKAKLELRAVDAQTKSFDSFIRGTASYPQTKRHGQRIGNRPPSGASASHLDLRSLDELRRDCQHLQRTNPVARGFLRVLANSVVGPGPKLRASTGSDEADVQVEALWNDWASNARSLTPSAFDLRRRQTLAASLRTLVRAMATDGDQMAVPVSVDGDAGCVQFIEGERVVNPGSTSDFYVPAGREARGAQPGGVISGVKVDGYMRPIAYHAADYSRDLSTVRNGFGKTKGRGVAGGEWIDAAEFAPRGMGAWFLTNPMQERTNELRGEPALAASVERFEKLDAIDHSVGQAYYMATCLALVITSPDPGAAQSSWAGRTVDRHDGFGDQERELAIGPGKIYQAPTGSQAFQVRPEHPSASYDSLSWMHYSHIGADLGSPYLLVLGDGSKSNYSGFRSAISLAFSNFRVWRQWLVDSVLTPMYRWKLAQWIVAGLVDISLESVLAGTHNRCRWTFPPPPMLDPKAEIEGFATGVREMLMTRQEAIAQLTGDDLEEFYGQREYEQKEERRRGIKAAPAPGSPNPNAGQEPGKPGASESDEQEDGDEREEQDDRPAPSRGRNERGAKR